MTRERLKELEPLVDAWLDGNNVEIKPYGCSGWTEFKNEFPWSSLEQPECQWRIKPGPRRWWVNLNCNVSRDARIFSTPEDARNWRQPGDNTICVQEIQL